MLVSPCTNCHNALTGHKHYMITKGSSSCNICHVIAVDICERTETFKFEINVLQYIGDSVFGITICMTEHKLKSVNLFQEPALPIVFIHI